MQKGRVVMDCADHAHHEAAAVWGEGVASCAGG